MHIFNLVVNRYESKIGQLLGTKSCAYIQNNKIGFMSVQIGIKPYRLLTESGARINSSSINRINYIKDPELRYLKKMPNYKFSIFSITETIDDIFNSIFQTINKILGNKAFLKFFLRRTLCGCEFGICLDLPMKSVYANNNFDSFSIYSPNCIIDKDPLILFSISIKSLLPVLAGVLIFLLIYAVYLAKDIIGWFVLFPEKLTKTIVTKGVFIIIDALGSSVTILLLNKLVSILKNILNKQLDKLKNTKYEDAFNTINDLLTIFDSETFGSINKKISSKFGTKIRINFKWQEIIKKCIHPEKRETQFSKLC